MHAQEDRVAVAVLAELLDRERVPGRLALAPEPAARAAEEVRLAGLAREAQRLVVHPREHEDAVRFRVLDDRGAQLRLHRGADPRPRSSSSSVSSRAGFSWRIEASSAACATSSAAATWSRRRPRRRTR